MTEPLGTTFRRCGDVRFRRFHDDAIVIRQSKGEALVLNEVARRILELTDGETPLAAVAERLGREFEADEATVRRETASFALELEDAGLIERVPERDA